MTHRFIRNYKRVRQKVAELSYKLVSTSLEGELVTEHGQLIKGKYFPFRITIVRNHDEAAQRVIASDLFCGSAFSTNLVLHECITAGHEKN